MKMNILYVGLCTVLLLVSCSETSPLEKALETSGSNRMELEKVLEHYRQDSLKLKAAEFLIENMTYHYAYDGKELEKYHKYFERVPMTWKGAEYVRDSLNQICGAFRFNSLYVVPDLYTVNSAFLIRHIDFAFKVWYRQPWGKQVSFENFLEYILPYRVGTERLSCWREELYARYNPMLDSIRATADSANVMAVAQALMDSLSVPPVHFTSAFPYGPTVGPSSVKWRTGNCRELTDLVTYVFRAVGIPCGCDKMLVRGDNNVAHYWNFVVDSLGDSYFASVGPSSKHFERVETYWNPKGKVWRETFSLNRDVVSAVGDDTLSVPKVFRVPLMRDVTAAYAAKMNRCLRISVDSLVLRPHSGETVYLCASSREAWLPVAYGYCEGDTVYVDDVEGDVVFRLAVFRKGHLVSLGVPFLLERYTGVLRFYRVSEKKERAVIFQKFKEDFLYQMVGGIFEASDNPDFLPCDTLYQIGSRPCRLVNTIVLQDTTPYRYIRYYGPENGYCNIAELAFYSSSYSTECMGGRLFFSSDAEEGYFFNQYSRVFDGDPYTSMESNKPSGGWVGWDFGRSVSIGKLVYMPRNRDNFIRKYDRYELFYATPSGWTSLGRQTALADSLVYDVPCGALLYLRNHTRGRDERIFEMKVGRQILW